MPSIAEMTKDEINLAALALAADATSQRPNWADVLPFLEANKELYYQHGGFRHGDRCCPGYSTLLEKLLAAAS